ncbi:MAG: pyruvate kinase [Peptococcaceae bacterium]|nr:pyruvate kinase [Peptococcaceae bacterium]
MRKTKIVCTLGPAADSPEMLKSLLEAGMDVARLNFSHGSHEEHRRRIRLLRQVCRETGRQAAVMLDTSGPEIRTRQVKGDKAALVKGQSFTLTVREVEGDETQVSVTYEHLPASVSPGQIILLDDGLIRLEVESATATDILCRVLDGGLLTNRRGVNIPGAELPFPVLTEKDKADLAFGVAEGVDIVAASFVRNARDVQTIRDYLTGLGGRQFIVSKIESRQGVDNLREIIAVSDGLMVARGDLGVEISPEDVPLTQKEMIRQCNWAGKTVITATQMLDSMMRNPRPTRAEASDVANAILDGTDAIMLSGETAAGAYPRESVITMDRIARRTEASGIWQEQFDEHFNTMYIDNDPVSDSVARAACLLAETVGAKAILTSTQGGYTARQVSRFRPRCLVVATTPEPEVARQLLMSWGVIPLLVESHANTDELMAGAIEAAVRAGFVGDGDIVILTAGIPAGKSGSTNLIKVHRIGESLR